jgi:hypothetical protein
VDFWTSCLRRGQRAQSSTLRISVTSDDADTRQVTPESGIGTTIVAESVASLANHLKRLVDNSAGEIPEPADIEACLKSFEDHRHPRASLTVKHGLQNVRFFTMANRTVRMISKYIAPNVGGESTQSEKYIAAEKVDYLPVPPRSLTGTMAFNPTQGYGKMEPRKPRAMLALPLLLLAVNAWRTEENPTLVSQMLNLPMYLLLMTEGSRRAYLLNPIQWQANRFLENILRILIWLQ